MVWRSLLQHQWTLQRTPPPPRKNGLKLNVTHRIWVHHKRMVIWGGVKCYLREIILWDGFSLWRNILFYHGLSSLYQSNFLEHRARFSGNNTGRKYML